VPFNAALAPGPKTFDANLSELSITDQRKAAVDFSSPYFDVTQAVVTVKSSRAAGVKTVHQLRTLRLGVQVGTTSYTAATSVDGDVPVEVYNTNGDAKMA
jgi:polar amino acid transport system substrate-binding protein